MDPPNVGRDVKRMVAIAEQLKGKLNIIMATGFHKAAFYDKGSSWLAQVPVNEIVPMLVAEIEEGMDLYNYSGPVVKRGKAKAGIIKAGTGYAAIDRLELKALEAVAITSITPNSVPWHMKQHNTWLILALIRGKFNYRT